MKEIKLQVEGMKCEGCENRIKNSLSKLNGIKEVEANYQNKSVFLKVEDNVSVDNIKEKIEDLGFEVLE